MIRHFLAHAVRPSLADRIGHFCHARATASATEFRPALSPAVIAMGQRKITWRIFRLEQFHRISKLIRIPHFKDALSAIEAVLPAGTLSGAPKIRACQLIAELENNKRGIYGGAIGYIDFTGNMDTCIAIRIAYKKNGKVFVRSGAGIVADSVPEKEFEECLNKAKASLKSLELAQEVDE